MVYCTNCGSQNPQGARFCSNCAAPLALGTAVPPGAPAPPPYQPPYAPPQPRQSCESRPREQEECMGQSRVPGFIVFALIILLIGIFAVIQWYVQVAFPSTYSTYSGVIWPIFGIVLALFLIGVWLVARPRAR